VIALVFQVQSRELGSREREPPSSGGLDQRLRLRELDINDKTGAIVVGRDLAAVQFDGAAGDGQTQPDAATGPATVALDAEERLENGPEHVVRHAGALITHADFRHVPTQFQRDRDRGSQGSVADGVAHPCADRGRP